MFRLINKKIIAILHLKNLLNWPNVLYNKPLYIADLVIGHVVAPIFYHGKFHRNSRKMA